LEKRDQVFFGFALFICLLFVYSNSFHASWQFDDEQNILIRESVHITDITVSSLKQSLEGSFSPLALLKSRSVSYLSFALNWYVGQDDPFGYHVVNFLIHFFNAFLVYFITLRLLSHDGTISNQNLHSIAMVSTILWALHPIQIQSVTYIVQRMNSLCAFFYLSALLMFFRLYDQKRYIICRFSLIVFYSLMAIACKQNGALVGLSFLLVVIVYGNPLKDYLNRRFFHVLAAFIALLVVLVIFDAVFEWSSVYSGYESRTYTKMQRFLTQPRVILFYLYQLFLPSSGIYSIAHSFSLSTSIVSPISTLWSVLCIVFLVIGSFFAVTKGHRTLGFSILFFFINHLMESTVIPLEIVYEHRNYIPSLFLFLPISMAFVWFSESPNFSLGIRGLVSVCLCFVIIHLGVSTFIRNKDWATPRTLWASAVPHGKDLARVYQNLSTTYSASTAEGLKSRILLNMKALPLKDSTKGKAEYLSLRNIAGAYGEFGDYERAISYLKKAYDKNESEQDTLLLATLLFRSGKLDEMNVWLDLIDPVSLRDQELKELFRMKAIYFINMREYDQARFQLVDYIKLGGDLTYPYVLMGNIHLALGNDDIAIDYLSRISEHQLLFDLYLLYAYALSGDEGGVYRSIQGIEGRYTVSEIRKMQLDLPHMKNIPRVERRPSLNDVVAKYL